VEVLGGAPVVGEEQQPEPDLGHEQRLSQDEQVRDQSAGQTPAPVDETADERSERGDTDDEKREQAVGVQHPRSLTSGDRALDAEAAVGRIEASAVEAGAAADELATPVTCEQKIVSSLTEKDVHAGLTQQVVRMRAA
jgi:hypothetical protein